MSKPSTVLWAVAVALGMGSAGWAQDTPLILSAELEMQRIPAVGSAWQTIPIVNDLTNPVVTCTYVLPSAASNDALVRLRNVGPSGFELRVQQFETSNSVTASDVYCMIAETGAHTLADGRAFEAGTILSDGTNGRAAGWGVANSERIDTVMSTTFTNPVVFGSVMTFNDAKASVFWTWNGANRGQGPQTNRNYVGKHIGSVTGTRNNETLGYIVFEQGSGTVNGLSYVAQKGSDSIAGVGNAPPYNYTVSGDLDMAILTQVAEDGGDGGWAVLYGSDPLPAGQIALAIEEEVFERDMTRTHTQEEVFYFGVEAVSQTETFVLDKTVAIHPDSSSDYMIPGADVAYTLSLENTGNGATDTTDFFVHDTLPAELIFVNGDANGSAVAGTDPVAITIGANSGLGSPVVGYRNAASAPTDIGDCTDGPGPAVRHVCVQLSGAARPGALYSDVAVDITFQARIE